MVSSPSLPRGLTQTILPLKNLIQLPSKEAGYIVSQNSADPLVNITKYHVNEGVCLSPNKTL